MFDGYQNKRHILESTHVDVPHCFGQLRHTICQKQTQPVARNNEHGEIDGTLQKLSP